MRQPEDVSKLRAQLRADATMNGSYGALLVVSAIVAALGLEQNSAATIIGAMVVAPLMLPIRALGFAVLRFDRDMLRASLIALCVSVATVVLLGAAVGYLSFRPHLSSEILSRTSVTFLGLGVALAGGILAALSRTEQDSKITDSLIGVGISVALVPPLCAAGITFAEGAWYQSSGAMMIFVTNLIGIGLACAIVFLCRGYASRQAWRSAAGLCIFAVLIAAIAPTLAQTGYRARQLNGVQSFLDRNASAYLPSVVDVESTSITWSADPPEIVTVVRGSRAPAKTDVRRLKDAIVNRFGQQYALSVVQEYTTLVTP